MGVGRQELYAILLSMLYWLLHLGAMRGAGEKCTEAYMEVR